MLQSYEKCQKIGFGRELGQVRTKSFLAQAVRNFFLFNSTLPMMIQISGKNAHLAQNCNFHEKTTSKQSCKLFKVKFLT